MTLLAEPRRQDDVHAHARSPIAALEQSAGQPQPQSNDWLLDWCRSTSFEDRLAGINMLSKRRLPSHTAAEVWLHLIAKAKGLITPEELQLLLRQFIMLAPEHGKASVMYDLLMNTQPAGATQPELVFMITSCERYMPQARRVLADLQARGADACIVVGDPSLAIAVQEGPLVRLPVPDTYEALPSKVLEGLTFLRRRHGQISVVKIDDDMHLSDRLDLGALARTAQTMDYAGHPIGDHTCDRCWHVGKTSVPTPIFSRRHHGRFAYGPMYLLGPRAVEHLVREWVFYPGEFAGHIYEDRAVGDALRKVNIEVKPLSFAQMGGVLDQVERYVAPLY